MKRRRNYDHPPSWWSKTAWWAYDDEDREFEEAAARTARSFPSLDACLGDKPLDPLGVKGPDNFTFSELLDCAQQSGQAYHAASFVIGAFFKPEPWLARDFGEFNIFEAVATWNDAHRAAFLDWAKNGRAWWDTRKVKPGQEAVREDQRPLGRRQP